MGSTTAHLDTFARDNLPPREEWPALLLDNPDVSYPERLNAVSELLDRWVEGSHGGAPAVGTIERMWSYRELQVQVNRIANVLVNDLGLVPGGRVLLRAPNSPMLVAAYLAALKAGGVVVATMPLLRTRELVTIADKARIDLALCDWRLLEEIEKARAQTPFLKTVVPVGSQAEGDLVRRMERAGDAFEACPTAAEDVALIGFTSGTTGVPKGTMHFHRDLLAVCDTYGRHVLRASQSDLFTGSPPLAFTFGLGGLTLFPMRVGAAAVMIEKPTPDALLEAIRKVRPTVLFTTPIAYRALLSLAQPGDLDSLATCVSAGEHLPRPVFDAWKAATGRELMDGIGATEMLHIFIGAPQGKIRAGSTGLPVPGFEARVIDPDGRDCAPGEAGRLAVRGPTGCRYLADPRQRQYVQDGWNVTGDTYVRDRDGYFWYQARSDDMIVSSGYNIAGPEVEEALLTHPAVAECGVVGAPDPERGTVVRAYVVCKPDHTPGDALVRDLQEHVKREIAPYKYPRSVVFVDALPRTQTGKLQRFELRRRAAEGAP
jgi:2-aminobenzoate-CoA ligase